MSSGIALFTLWLPTSPRLPRESARRTSWTQALHCPNATALSRRKYREAREYRVMAPMITKPKKFRFSLKQNNILKSRVQSLKLTASSTRRRPILLIPSKMWSTRNSRSSFSSRTLGTSIDRRCSNRPREATEDVTSSIRWEPIMSLQVLMLSLVVRQCARSNTITYMTMNISRVQVTSLSSHANPTQSLTPSTAKWFTENVSLKSVKWLLWPKWWQLSVRSNWLKSSNWT